ncbi:hypothetical protein L1049_015747 [Liquidambar formosana]|uniref:F-box domain-containing protein n=1 Tax=Liquidambar formosana TaxID=63359 RepID=A0AAP0X232_LIQFO
MTRNATMSITITTELGLGFRILELPEHIVFDILTRLPVKSVFACRCVCKTLRDLLLDPHFAKLHLTRAPTALILHQRLSWSIHLYLPDVANDTLSWYSSSSYSDHHRDRCYDALPKQDVYFLMPDCKAALINSCNGFLCLYNSSRRHPVYCLCNPVLGEYVALPPPPPSTVDHTYLDYSAFGFSPKTGQYKIIRFVLSLAGAVFVEVHTLGSESWRNVGEAPPPRHPKSFDPFVNGALHWITTTGGTTSGLICICSFDVEDERIRQIPPPAHFDFDYAGKVGWINVGVLGGCLCLCYVFDGVSFEVWVMKDYGVKESWSKKFVIEIQSYCGLQLGEVHRPIGFLENGDMWMICHSDPLVLLVSYRPGTRSFKEICGIKSSIEAIPHIPSFASLKNEVIGKNLQVKDVKPGKALRF